MITRKVASELLKKKTNIMEHLRQNKASDTNDVSSIGIAYDLQTGSYIEDLKDPAMSRFKDTYGKELAGIINAMDCVTVLEAGIGEGTMLRCTYPHLVRSSTTGLYGFDISWSRIRCGGDYLSEGGIHIEAAVGELAHPPYRSSSIDVVYTSHAIEPNRGREREIISQLYRVARKYLILLEPSYENASNDGKKYMDKHRFCMNIEKTVNDLQYEVLEYRQFVSFNELNPTWLMVIKKDHTGGMVEDVDGLHEVYACPSCEQSITLIDSNYYCSHCFMIFPVIRGIPCLLRDKGILGSWYLRS